MSLAVEYFEIDVPYCSLTYGVAPCQASLTASPPTGTAKCFNCLSTCQDTANFTAGTATLRFAKPAEYLPRDIDIVGAFIRSVDFTPSTVSLGEDLGQRAVLKVQFSDFPHSDAGEGLDKYQAERGYDPFQRGSFWPRFRARYPSVQGFACRWRLGFVGDALADMETRYFFAESFEGPRADGSFSIEAKDALKFLDGSRAQAPALSGGSLSANITATDTSLTLIPTGVGATDYPRSSDPTYVALSGNEVAQYYRDATAGNDANTLLLLHFDGTDGATSTTDSSSFARSATRTGDAQIDTAQSKFLQSSLFDGTGDGWTFADSNDWTFSGNFTVECFARFSSLAASRAVFGHGSGGANQYRLIVATNGAATFEVISGGVTIVTMTSAAAAIVIDTMYHLAVVRVGTVWTIYKDGASIATTTDADAIPNFAGNFRVGLDGNAANGMAGWIDEFRVSNVARYTTTFTPPLGPFAASSDVLTLVRGLFGTTAATHSAGDRVQRAIRYTTMDPADIAYDLISNYTDLPLSYVTLADWQAETAAYLGALYTFTIVEPTPVAEFLARLCQQAGLAIFDDPLAQQLRLRVIRAVPVTADTISDSDVIAGSFDPTDQFEKRVSRVQVYFAVSDPTQKREDLDNYLQSVEVQDLASEALYGLPAIKRVFADGIPFGGSGSAERVGTIIIGRYQQPPRRFRLTQLRGAGIDVSLGQGYNLQWRSLQDASGAQETVPTQCVRFKPGPAINEALLEEMRFSADSDVDPSNRVINIDIADFNINLRDIHDTLYASTFDGITVTFNISATIGSTSTGLPAVDVGSWPVGFTPSVVVTGRIQGRGGNGGSGNSGDADPGSVGGPALYTRHSINLTDTSGEIWGGGGGGGGGGGTNEDKGGGGGGGAGTNGGTKGNGSGGEQNGTSEAGGSGGPGIRGSGAGGAGGGPGLAGSNGSNSALHNGASGAAAGASIDGVSFVTTVGGAGDRRGGQIN